MSTGFLAVRIWYHRARVLLAGLPFGRQVEWEVYRSVLSTSRSYYAVREWVGLLHNEERTRVCSAHSMHNGSVERACQNNQFLIWSSVSQSFLTNISYNPPLPSVWSNVAIYCVRSFPTSGFLLPWLIAKEEVRRSTILRSPLVSPRRLLLSPYLASFTDFPSGLCLLMCWWKCSNVLRS